VDDQRGPLQLDLNEDNLFGKLDKSLQVAEVTEQRRRGFRISDADGLEACKRVLKELDIKVPQKLEERVSSIGEKSDVRLLEQVANMGDLIVTSFANLVASSDDSALMVRNSIANRLKPDEPADEVLSMVSDCFMRSALESEVLRRAFAAILSTVKNKDFYLQQSFQRATNDLDFFSQFCEQFHPQLRDELSRGKSGRNDARKPRPNRCTLEGLGTLELSSRKSWFKSESRQRLSDAHTINLQIGTISSHDL